MPYHVYTAEQPHEFSDLTTLMKWFTELSYEDQADVLQVFKGNIGNLCDVTDMFKNICQYEA